MEGTISFSYFREEMIGLSFSVHNLCTTTVFIIVAMQLLYFQSCSIHSLFFLSFNALGKQLSSKNFGMVWEIQLNI